MLVIRNGRIHTISNGIIDRGSILIENGKIVAIGTSVPEPAGARIIDAEGRWVQPGIIEAHGHLGVSEQGIGSEGNDVNEMVDPCTPHVRAIDGINPKDEGLRDALEAGITATWITPGSANVIGGQGATCRTWGATVEDMVINPFSAMKAALGENPKRVYSGKSKITTRLGTAGCFRETMYKAKAYLRKQESAREKGSDLPDYDLRLEPLLAVLRKEVPMRIHAHRQDDIMTALRFAREFDFELTIEHCSEGYMIADQLAAEPRLRGVVVGPILTAKGKIETANKDWAAAGVMQRAGVRTAIMTDHPVTPVQYLPICAAYSNKYGMDENEALKAITLNAAIISGVGDRVGSLELGKEADIAIFTGHPFDTWRTHTVATIIAGQVAYSNPKFM
ncbi:MAG TPA: amidohydrolase [Symbiobacteriaceae bacterium]|nr:amidohydrolase [Symbiobacteriaceae bacterium]